MSVDYNNFATTFSNSRKNMKWEEIDYLIDFLNKKNSNWISILDIGCWNGRLLAHIENSWIKIDNYLWTDLSSWLIQEAKKLHPNHSFQVLDMVYISEIAEKFDYIFFIASFHHLQTIKERIKVLKQIKNLLKPDWVIFMTNWALNSELNSEKYKKSIIENSKNEFWSQDYSIKIGEFTRFYHSFTLEELDFLFRETWFEVVENKLFENGRNWVSIIENR